MKCGSVVGAASLATLLIATTAIRRMVTLRSKDPQERVADERPTALTAVAFAEMLLPLLAAALAALIFFVALFVAGFYPGGRVAAKDIEFLSGTPWCAAQEISIEAADVSAQAVWGVTVAATVLATLAAFWIVSGVWLESRKVPRFLVLAVVIGVVIASVVGLQWIPSFGGAVSGQMISSIQERANRPNLGTILDAFNVIALFVPAAIVMSASLLLDPARRRFTGRADILRDAARCWRTLDRLLYVGAVVMVAGLLEVVALHAWAYAPFPGVAEVKIRADICRPPSGGFTGSLAGLDATALCTQLKDAVEHADMVDQLKGLTRSLGLTFGAGFSLLLATLYIPAALMLQKRVEGQLAEEPPSERKKLLKAHGLATDIGQRVMAAGATLAPLVAGLLSSIFDFKL